MRQMILIESQADGVLLVNGQFCGPMEREGQAFPCGKNEEIYIQFFPFGSYAPLTAKLLLRAGQIAALEPQENCFALLWPGGIIQMELHIQGWEREPAQERQAASNVLLHYLALRLAGDDQAQRLLIQKDARDLPALDEYHAVVPLRAALTGADERFDVQAGLVRRAATNIACVDAVLGTTVPIGQGRRLLESMEIIRT